MFTGLIQGRGEVCSPIHHHKLEFQCPSSLLEDVKIGHSLAVNGACLSVEIIQNQKVQVHVGSETLKKTTLGDLQKGDQLNLEPCLKLSDRLQGHFVLGHIDTKIKLIQEESVSASKLLTFRIPQKFFDLCVPRGSLALRGVSLTIAERTYPKEGFFDLSLMIIPLTWEKTNLSQLVIGQNYEVEFDYFAKLIAQKNGSDL
jgi:riboflavin synthase